MSGKLHSKQDWANALSEKRTKRVWVYCVIGSLITLILVILAKNLLIPKCNDILWLQNILEVGVDAFTSVATGVLGAAVLNIAYDKKENKALKMLRSLSYVDLLSEFYHVLDAFHGKCRLDERIEVEMKPFMDGNQQKSTCLIMNDVDYEFRTNKIKDSIKLRFERCLDGNVNPYLSGMNKELNGLEFYWGNDETGEGFKTHSINQEAYKVTRVSVEGKALQIPKPQITETEKGNPVITYDIPLTQDILENLEEDGYVQILLSVSFPMDSESIMFISHEYPTHDSKVSVNYSGIADDTVVYVMPVTGPIPVGEPLPGKEHYCEYRHRGWLIPKTGYIIAWWK